MTPRNSGRVGLIACSKTKLDHAAPAAELYASPFFKKSLAWIQKRHDTYGILSAKYGLIMPDQVIEPYDVYLGDLSQEATASWCKLVHAQLMEKWGDRVIYQILAGSSYRIALTQMPMVEDVIGCWTQWRLDKGMGARQAQMSIGLILKALKEDRNYY